MDSLSTTRAEAKAKAKNTTNRASDINHTDACMAMDTPGSSSGDDGAGAEEIEATATGRPGLWANGMREGGIRGKRKPGEPPGLFIMHSAYKTISATTTTYKNTTGRLQEPSPDPTPSPPTRPVSELKNLTQGPEIGSDFPSHDPDPLTKRARSIFWNYPTPRFDSPCPNNPNGLQLRLPPPLISFPLDIPTPPSPPTSPNPPHTHRSIYTQLAYCYTKNLLPANHFLGTQDPDTGSSYRLLNFTQEPSPSAEWDRQYLYFILRLQERGINCHNQFPVPTKPYSDPLPDSVPIDLRIPPGFWAHQSLPGGNRKRCFGFVSGQVLGRGWWCWIMSGYLLLNGVERMQIFELPAGGKLKRYPDLTSAAKGIAEGRPGVSRWELTIMPNWERENRWAAMRRAAVELQEEKKKWDGKEGGKAVAAREKLRQLEWRMQMEGQGRKRQAQVASAAAAILPSPPPPHPQPNRNLRNIYIDPSWSPEDESRDLAVFRDSIQGSQLSKEEESRPSQFMLDFSWRHMCGDGSGEGEFWVENAWAEEERSNTKELLLKMEEKKVVGGMQRGGSTVLGGTTVLGGGAVLGGATVLGGGTVLGGATVLGGGTKSGSLGVEKDKHQF
ncbi:hypothetical protein BGX38DRAFT_1143996 [Terfezia claveryi]|nr:hypothetical protein BGX38DRAFT_1143996 [Terfezia claveryi]